MTDITSTEVAGLEEALELLIKKINRLRAALVLETDEGRKFQYEEQIRAGELEKLKLDAKLSSVYSLHGSSGAQLVLQKIDEIGLEIEAMGEQDLVNVNREAEREYFFDQFDQLIKSNFQFYYISGCSTQMPHSFSEWAVLEVAFTELEEELSAMLYRRHADSNRVQIMRLPVGRNLDRSKRAFKKFFAEYFSFKTHQTFDKYIETGLPALSYEYVAFVFELDANSWKPDHQKYLQWIINTFQHNVQNMPTFLFFFVFVRGGLHDKAEPEYAIDAMVKDLDQLAATNEATVHISPLRPVPVLDLKRWFRQLGERNPARVEEVIELMVKGLKPQDQQLFVTKQQLNMDDVERLQSLIYNWYLSTE